MSGAEALSAAVDCYEALRAAVDCYRVGSQRGDPAADLAGKELARLRAVEKAAREYVDDRIDGCTSSVRFDALRAALAVQTEAP